MDGKLTICHPWIEIFLPLLILLWYTVCFTFKKGVPEFVILNKFTLSQKQLIEQGHISLLVSVFSENRFAFYKGILKIKYC